MTPDLTAMGKIIGGGFPVGALAGRKEVMDVMDPLADKILFPHSGTFSANPVTMTAGRVSMELFDREAVAYVNQLAASARSQIAEAIRISEISACVTGAGSMFRIHMKPDAPINYWQAFVTSKESNRIALLLDHLYDHGIIMINTCSGTISTVMTEKEIGDLAEAMLGGFREIKAMTHAGYIR